MKVLDTIAINLILQGWFKNVLYKSGYAIYLHILKILTIQPTKTNIYYHTIFTLY